MSYLRLTKECNESMIELTANGPTVMAIQEITNKARRLGIDNENNNNNNNTPSFPPSEEQQIHNYMSKNNDATFDAGITDTDTDINRNNNYNTNESELS